jgi:hypothetical protein
MESDTPRTDAVQFRKKPISLTIENEMLRSLSRELERELNESKEETEDLIFLNASQAKFERLRVLMHQTIWFVDDMIKTHANGCEHCFNKHGAMITLFKDITIEPQWPINPTEK